MTTSAALHVIGLPHVQTIPGYETCAYGSKIVKFCRMMHGHDRRVILYAGEQNDAPCDEHVVCVTEDQQRDWFGPHDENDLNRGGFDWDTLSPWWQAFNAACAREVAARVDERDLLLLIAGQAQQPVADANPALTVAEFGVGYEGILNVGGSHREGGPAYCAFESYAHMHQVYRRWDLHNSMNDRWFDAVIPNYFDPDEFPQPDERDGSYLLFVGRLIANKGAHVAARIAAELNMPLIVAGPGALDYGSGWIQAAEVRIEAPKLEYVGVVGSAERAAIMANAAVTLAPTLYTEPFGGVAVESMLAGTPVVTTDHGAFPETVQEGVSGFRFRTLGEGCDGVERAMNLDRDAVRRYALERYSLDAVRPLYERWFDRLDLLWGDGWDTLPSGRREADADSPRNERSVHA